MKSKLDGFTLIELIIVIVIIGILALVALPRYFANLENSRRSEAYGTMRAYLEAETAYYDKNGFYLAINNSGPISVDMDGDGMPEISVSTGSSNFTFAVNASGSSSSITATHRTGTVDYYMCVESSKVGSGAPACP